MKFCTFIIAFILSGCSAITLPVSRTVSPLNGSQFYDIASGYSWKQRDSLAIVNILGGNMPSFLLKFVPVSLELFDSARAVKNDIIIYVSPDYVSVGTDEDWARIPLTPMAAKRIADHFDCVLPTVKMVDAIYKSARIKLAPVPLFAFRDSTPTMYHHHLIIEGQRKGLKGLIAGIKKDVVQFDSSVIQKKNRVAIYGWHKPDGKPIQPFYTGHVNWYVDYSHGIRLVYRKIKVNGKWRDVEEVLGGL